MRGLVAVVLSGISAGAFPLPEKKIVAWKWEHVWAVYSLVAMCILPVLTALLFAPGIFSLLAAHHRLLTLEVAASGLLFGLGSVLFGISLVRLGMAITNALVSGIIVFLGSLGPLLIGSVHLAGKQLALLIVGLAMLVGSLILCSAAAVSRDEAQSVAGPVKGSRSWLALGIAVLAGCFSAMLNIGFTVGASLSTDAAASSAHPMLATLAIWIPALLGGAILNVGFPLYLVARRRTWQTFAAGVNPGRPWLLASLMGLLWFGNILLYGYGASNMTAGAVYGWAISSAASILTSNALGAAAGEWRGSGAPAKIMMAFSTLLLIGSFALLATQSLST